MEFLVEFELEVPRHGSQRSEQRQRAESAAAASSRRTGISSGSGDGSPSATEQRRSGCTAPTAMPSSTICCGALPLAGWLSVAVTPLAEHANDPATAS
jgi:muconolactone delta-isomerase